MWGFAMANGRVRVSAGMCRVEMHKLMNVDNCHTVCGKMVCTL